MYYIVHFIKNDNHGVVAKNKAFDIRITAPDIPKALIIMENKIMTEGVLRIREGGQIPAPEEIPSQFGSFAIIDVDFNQMLKKEAKLTVRRTITLPEWMDLEIKNRDINASKLFYDAFMERYADDGQRPIESLGELKRRVDPKILEDFAKEYVTRLFEGGK